MKILCDVCEKDEASVFCVADEAALCAACDHRVHHANKLAGKHQRFSLHHPKQAPLCDICQERRAFLFCQQDRAILCIDCNISIHKSNQHTQKHTRFLLTGVKLSSNSTLYSPSSSSSAETASSGVSDDAPNIPLMVTPVTSTLSTSKSTTVQSSGAGVPAPASSCDKISNHQLMDGGDLSDSVSASSISEYLIEMLPGWHVEDLLDSSSPSPYGFCKNADNDLLPLWDGHLEQSNMSGYPTQKMGLWVPQVHPPLNQTQNQFVDLGFGSQIGMKEFSSNNNNNNNNNNIKCSRKRSEDSSFLVPQITPPLNASKKFRTFW